MTQQLAISIFLANHNDVRKFNEPITIQSKYIKSKPSAEKSVSPSYSFTSYWSRKSREIFGQSAKNEKCIAIKEDDFVQEIPWHKLLVEKLIDVKTTGINM